MPSSKKQSVVDRVDVKETRKQQMKRIRNAAGTMRESTCEKSITTYSLQFGCLMKQFIRSQIVFLVLNLRILSLFRVHTLIALVFC